MSKPIGLTKSTARNVKELVRRMNDGPSYLEGASRAIWQAPEMAYVYVASVSPSVPGLYVGFVVLFNAPDLAWDAMEGDCYIVEAMERDLEYGDIFLGMRSGENNGYPVFVVANCCSTNLPQSSSSSSVSSSASSSSSSSSSSSGGCCTEGLPDTLHYTIADGSGFCNWTPQSNDLTWNGSTYWTGPVTGGCVDEMRFFPNCSLKFYLSGVEVVTTSSPLVVSCEPFEIQFNGITFPGSAGAPPCGGCFGQNVTITE